MAHSVTIRGNIGAEPQLRDATNGQVLRFSVMDKYSRRVKTPSGFKEETVSTWRQCVVVKSDLANAYASQLHSGMYVEVEGFLGTPRVVVDTKEDAPHTYLSDENGTPRVFQDILVTRISRPLSTRVQSEEGPESPEHETTDSSEIPF